MIRPKCYGTERAITACANGELTLDDVGTCDVVISVICDSGDNHLGLLNTGENCKLTTTSAAHTNVQPYRALISFYDILPFSLFGENTIVCAL